MSSIPVQSGVSRLSSLGLRGVRGSGSKTARGDAAAFALIYERHHQELYRYCRSILRHEQDAQDALQNSMVKAFGALQHEERDFELRPWLFRIVHNEAISLLRRRRETGEMPDVAASAASVHDGLIEREDLRALQADLTQLPDAQRSALVLRELNGLGHAEIAQVLESSPGAVKQSIYEARSALLECREGREMACDAVRRMLSDGDGRVTRGRRCRAHLRSCTGCRQFRADLRQRPRDLAVLAPPLPALAGSALLAHVLGGTGKMSAGALSSTAGGGGLVGALTAKGTIVALAAVTAVGGTAVGIRAVVGHPGHGAQPVRAHNGANTVAPRAGHKLSRVQATRSAAAGLAARARIRSGARAVGTPVLSPSTAANMKRGQGNPSSSARQPILPSASRPTSSPGSSHMPSNSGGRGRRPPASGGSGPSSQQNSGSSHTTPGGRAPQAAGGGSAPTPPARSGSTSPPPPTSGAPAPAPAPAPVAGGLAGGNTVPSLPTYSVPVTQP